MRKRRYFRRQKTNLLLAFHLFEGFAFHAFSSSSPPFLFKLKMFGLLSRSVVYAVPSETLREKKYPVAVYYLESKIRQHRTPSFFFFKDTIYTTPQKALAVCALDT